MQKLKEADIEECKDLVERFWKMKHSAKNGGYAVKNNDTNYSNTYDNNVAEEEEEVNEVDISEVCYGRRSHFSSLARINDFFKTTIARNHPMPTMAISKSTTIHGTETRTCKRTLGSTQSPHPSTDHAFTDPRHVPHIMHILPIRHQRFPIRNIITTTLKFLLKRLFRRFLGQTHGHRSPQLQI